jgi:tRNA(Ile)-lysidine synthase
LRAGASDSPDAQLDQLLPRCTFPPPGTRADCAFSGGPDSTALVALAVRAGLDVVAHHVDHGLRPESATEAGQAGELAERLGVPLVLHTVEVGLGANLEARARDARYQALPPHVMTGHTADDQAETVLLRLLRGTGGAGMAAIAPGRRHPILALRRAETLALSEALGLTAVCDPSNDSPAIARNRVRNELLPLANQIAGRDVVPLLARTAGLLRDDEQLLTELSGTIDPTDAKALVAAPPVLARRAIRRWLTVEGYPPDVATVERVMAVARGEATACELAGGRRLERTRQRFRIVDPNH